MHTWKACFPTCISEPFLVVLQTSLLHIPEQPRGLHTLKYASIFKRVYPDRFGCSANIPKARKRMPEAQLMSIHFLAVFCVLKTPHYIPGTTKRLELHLGKLAFLRVYPSRFWLFLKHPYYTFYPLNPLSKEQWKIIIRMR